MGKSIFEIYKELGIEHHINVEEVLSSNFGLVTQMPKHILDQISTDDLCEMDVFLMII